MEPITRKELFMAKAAGQNVNVPDPITREEKFLAAICGSGGGGAQPDWNAAEGEPGHILNRPFYEHTITLFDQTVELQETEEGMLMMSTFPEPLEDKTYKVTYNGVPYDCTPFVTDEYTAALGNLSAMGGPDTGEPFIIVIGGIDGVFQIVLVDLTGATSATVKIEKPGELRKIDSKFSPDIPYFDLVDAGLGVINSTQYLGALIDASFYKAFEKGPVKIRYKYKQKYGTEEDVVSIVTGTRDYGGNKNLSFTIPHYNYDSQVSTVAFVIFEGTPEGAISASVAYVNTIK